MSETAAPSTAADAVVDAELRVGIEARISHLKRRFGFHRTRLRRPAGAQAWAGLGIFAYNLQRMAVVSR